MRRIQVVAIVVLAAATCVLSVLLVRANRLVNEKSKPTLFYQTDFQPEETPVQVKTIHMGNLFQYIKATGYVRSPCVHEFRPEVSGNVKELRVKDGDFLRKGQILLALDNRRYELECENARTKLDNALLQYALEQKQLGEGPANGAATPDSVGVGGDENDREATQLLSSANRKKMLAHRTGVTEARLAYETAKYNLESTVLCAPFDGYVGQLAVNKHGYVAAGTKVAELVQMSPLEIEVGVLESEVRFVHAGAKAEVSAASLADRTISAQVSLVSPVIDRESGTCKVRVSFANPGNLLRPGMFASVRIATDAQERILLLPREGLLVRDGRKFAFVYSGGRAKWRYVTTGVENDEAVEITEGLSDGDSVIVSGHLHLNNDATVKITD